MHGKLYIIYNMPKITIIYRVCDSVDMLHTVASEPFHETNRNSARFYDVPKPYLIRKCLLSIRDAIEQAVSDKKNEKGIVVEFICVHDNCSIETLNFIREVIPDVKMVESNGHGNKKSFMTCAEIAKNIIDDETIVFFLEDDYSFLTKNGLSKAIGILEIIKYRTGEKCALFLDDYPDKYDEKGFRKNTNIMVTPYGHIMTVDSCTFSFMTYSSVIKENYDKIIGGKDEQNLVESESINKIWETVPLYCPIPALTLHCQLKVHIPEYFDANNIKEIIET